MSEYIYLAGNKPFIAGLIGDNPRMETNDLRVYDNFSDMESFYFELNYNMDDKETFSFSPYFSLNQYQISSIDLNLPTEEETTLNFSQQKAVQELFKFIKQYFEKYDASKLEILFCLNGDEGTPLKKQLNIQISDLRPKDLFYSNSKFLQITK